MGLYHLLQGHHVEDAGGQPTGGRVLQHLGELTTSTRASTGSPAEPLRRCSPRSAPACTRSRVDPHTVAFGLTRVVAAKTPMVTFEAGQYSVPHELLGANVWVRVHGRGAAEQVVIAGPGARSTHRPAPSTTGRGRCRRRGSLSPS